MIHLTLTEALAALAKGSLSCEELTQAYLEAMERCRPLNAFITETPERARAAAHASQQRYREGTQRPLEGLPLAFKDLFCTKDLLTTAASRILEGFVPPYESTVTSRLLDKGAVLLGKTNLDEFGMGAYNQNSAYGAVKSPWTLNNEGTSYLSPGGSSGGSASAVAAGAALGALGTDTGGSIRQPASWCGIVGVKPTYGLCSRWGMIAYASSLDQAGPMARTVEDAAVLLKAMAGFDPKDATSARRSVPDYQKACREGTIKGVRGLRIALLKEADGSFLTETPRQACQKAAQWLEAEGAHVLHVSVPSLSYALPLYYILSPAEASSNLARYDGVRYGRRASGATLEDMYEKTRGEGFGREVKRRILIGTYVLSAGHYEAYYMKARKVREKLKQEFAHVWDTCDLVLTPTTPSLAPEMDRMDEDPIAASFVDSLTAPANLTGEPALSLPLCLSQEGRPCGIQLMGPAFHEERLFQVASFLETKAEFKGFWRRG